MKRGRKKKLAISLMDYMGKRRDMKRQLKKEGTAELYEVAVRHFLRFVKNPGFCLADLNRALVIDFITYLHHLTITGPRIFALLFALYPVIDVLASCIC